MKVQFNTAPPPASGPKETPPQARATPEPTVLPAQTAAVLPSTETIIQVAHQINDFLKSAAADVEFSVDSQSDQVVVRVVDSETRQLIRQMPSEEMIAISKSMDRMAGLLLKQKA